LDAFNYESDTIEDLFTIQVNTQDGANDMHLFYATPDEGARGGDIIILQRHIAHEGHIIYDVKRNRGSIRNNINAEINYSYDDRRMVFPSPSGKWMSMQT
jgi:hydrogenase maturation factor